MRYVLVLLSCVFLMAGTNPEVSRRLASGAVGCAPAEIGISDELSSRGIHNFTAHCKGREFFCTYQYPAPITCNQRTDLSPEEVEQSRKAKAVEMTAWKARVLARIQGVWKKPAEHAPPMTAKMGIKIDDQGRLLKLYWVAKTGNKAVDKSIKKAFERAHPYPIPPDLSEAFAGVVFEIPAVDPAE